MSQIKKATLSIGVILSVIFFSFIGLKLFHAIHMVSEENVIAEFKNNYEYFDALSNELIESELTSIDKDNYKQVSTRHFDILFEKLKYISIDNSPKVIMFYRDSNVFFFANGVLYVKAGKPPEESAYFQKLIHIGPGWYYFYIAMM